MADPDPTITIGGPDSWSTSPPAFDGDWRDLFVTTFYDLGIEPYLRPNLILDQFCTPRNSRGTHNGDTRQISFVDDLDDATTPLVENQDVDSDVLTGRTLSVTQREYGKVVRRTEVVRGFSFAPFDPIAMERLGRNGGSTLDVLARNAMFASTLVMNEPDGTTITGTVATLAPTLSNGSPGYLATEVLQEGKVMLGEQKVEPFDASAYVLVTGDRGVQHLRAENANAAYRDTVIRNEGRDGNSIFMGEAGVYEGCRVVISRHLSAGQALLFGRDAFIKYWPMVEGFGPTPQAVLSPQTDNLRRFVGFGWKWMGGYSLFRPQAVVRITHATTNRAFGANNDDIGATTYSEA